MNSWFDVNLTLDWNDRISTQGLIMNAWMMTEVTVMTVRMLILKIKIVIMIV